MGLVELGYKRPAKALSAPVGFQVFGDATTEPEIELVATTSPPFKMFRILARDPRDSIELSVLSNLSPEPVKLRLPVQRARLALRAKTTLQGWGLERADVTVASSDGEASKGQIVVLEAPLGNLTADKLCSVTTGPRARLFAPNRPEAHSSLPPAQDLNLQP